MPVKRELPAAALERRDTVPVPQRRVHLSDPDFVPVPFIAALAAARLAKDEDVSAWASRVNALSDEAVRAEFGAAAVPARAAAQALTARSK
jgi:hypothetical protein